jgi:hypothetical protein
MTTKQQKYELDVVGHTCDPSDNKAEASLGYIV